MTRALAGTTGAPPASMEILLLPLALLGGFIVLLVIGLIDRWRRGRPSTRDVHIERLRARYARGEIGRREYDRRRRELEHRARPSGRE
jgi:uncharacterized membrane protein